LATARALVEHTPAGVLKIALFMNQTRSDVVRITSALAFDMLQFHGDEDNAFCRSFGLPFIKAVSAASGNAAADSKGYPDAVGILFDSHVPGGAGGTGRTLDWGRLGACGLPVWLAGGLDEHNVAMAVAAVQPSWVDVSSGVEDAPGIKNHERMRAFVAAVMAAAVGNDLDEESL
jgi:phosphoribosylanthranilate isomerase